LKIWVDADACPKIIKEILYNAARKRSVLVTFVANQVLQLPVSENIKFLKVQAGFDVADNEIVKRVKSKDLVITADIPLAQEVLQKDAFALNPRGELYSNDSIEAKVTMRDFYDTMRSSGLQTGGPPPLTPADKRNFANELDKVLTQNLKNKTG
jgi:uncharacterized protein YaiI (UPF0178 family)